MRLKSLLLATLVAFVLTGCGSSYKPLYYWGDYQPKIYAHLKNSHSSSAEQLGAMDETLQKARSNDLPMGPGFYAHVALLHLEDGNLDEFKKHMELEKELFPESSHYVDFILKNLTKK